MKLNIEELAKQAGIIVDNFGFVGGDTFYLEYFARLIVERCAAVADDADCRFDGHAIATEIRDMLEDK